MSEEQKMTEEQRENEEIRQEKKEAGVGEIVPGAGSRGTPRRMDQMVSVRLDGNLIARLKSVARRRGLTLSDLLREGAELIVQDAYKSARPRMSSYTSSGAREALSTEATGRARQIS